MNSTSLPQNLNIIQKPKPYDYNYIISMSYRLNGTEKWLDLPLNKSYGKIKYAKVTGYRYFNIAVFTSLDICHIHIANSDNPIYLWSAYSGNNNVWMINYYINYGVFDGTTIPITLTGYDVNCYLELFINYYY